MTRTRKAPRNTSISCWRSASPPPRSASPTVTAVLAAAGSGQRLGAGGPKAFVPLAGRPMLAWSVAALAAAEPVGEIVVACPPGHLDLPGLQEAGLERASLRVVEGGRERSESVRNAIDGVESELVAIHDAARPLLTPGLAEGVIATLAADSDAAGAIAATPVVDTIKQASSGLIESTLDRARLWAAQTPQVFRAGALREALADADALASATDEAMLVEALGGKVLIHPSPAENLKVTTPLDLRLAEMLLSR